MRLVKLTLPRLVASGKRPRTRFLNPPGGIGGATRRERASRSCPRWFSNRACQASCFGSGTVGARRFQAAQARPPLGNLVVRVGVCHHGVRREGLAGLWGSLRGRCASAACWRSGPDGSKWCARSKARMRGSDLVLALRPGWTHPGGAPSRASRRLSAYAVAASRKGVSVRHMACRITASLRARATLAFRGPVRSAIARAQSRRRDAPSLRVMMALAAS